jgi:hypothetical protein
MDLAAVVDQLFVIPSIAAHIITFAIHKRRNDAQLSRKPLLPIVNDRKRSPAVTPP